MHRGPDKEVKVEQLAEAAMPESAARPSLSRRLGLTWLDAGGLGGLAVLAWFFLDRSWRKWPDPMVDFGRELYLPWRLSEGALLYRDVDHLYGPFSPYFNSLVFRLGGVGLMSLVTVNLMIYSITLTLIYYIVREGWGRWVAVVAGAFFVGVFSFSHLVGIANYNFIAPYAHEATHGILLVLVLIVVGLRVLERPTTRNVLGAGVLVGWSVLMKVEIMIVAAAIMAGVLALHLWRHGRALFCRQSARLGGTFLLGAVIPIVVATVLLALGGGFSWGQAFRYANYAWVSVLDHANVMNDPLQKNALGTDRFGENIGRELVWGSAAAGVGFATALGCRWFCKVGDAGKIVLVLAAEVALMAMFLWVAWRGIGTAFPGLLVLAAWAEWRRVRREPPAVNERARMARVLLWLAGTAFLARMAFNPRVFHYGFFQAALAGTVSVAALLSAAPDLLRLDAVARRNHQVILSVLVLAGGSSIAGESLQMLAMQTQPVSTERDQFFAFDPRMDPTGAIIEGLRQYLAKDSGAHTLTMLPDGLMLNYLTRLPSTVPQYLFFPSLLEGGREEVTLQRLKAAPPDRVVLLTDDLRDVRADYFGDAPGHGKLLLDFVLQNYQPVGQIGADPMKHNPNERGAILFKFKTAIRSSGPAAADPSLPGAP